MTKNKTFFSIIETMSFLKLKNNSAKAEIRSLEKDDDFVFKKVDFLMNGILHRNQSKE